MAKTINDQYFYICRHRIPRMLIYNADCRHFRGDLPCKPHKTHGYHCLDCPVYEKISSRILIIKLGAIGDVIRTTPLIERYRKEYPGCKITWLTLTPDILPKNGIDEILKLDLNAVLYLEDAHFDVAVNLDKEKEAGALLSKIKADKKFGYILKDNVIQPVNELAFHKYHTGLFDDISKSNTLSYCEEIFQLCGFEYQLEPYLMDSHEDKGYTWDIDHSSKVIGMNTGCGGRWVTRLWSIDKWVELANTLTDKGYNVILLGGEQEDPRNKEIASRSKAKYFGFFPLEQFINLVYQCDLVVTQVTMGFHISLGLNKKVVLMNNIFNPNEFNLFGKGEIVQPNKPCDCFYKGTCVHGISCMEELPPQKVAEAVERTLAT